MADPVLMNPWIPVLAAFGGSAITGIINFLINRSNKKSEEQKHKSSLILQAAIENWKQHIYSAHKLARPGKRIRTHPLDMYIIHMSKLVAVLMDKNVSSSNIRDKIIEVNNFSEKARNTYDDIDKD